MPSPRRKNTATADDIVHLLKAGLPEGLGKGVQFSDENEVFAEQQELLLRELLLTTPRPTLKLLTSAAELAFQDGDKGVIENFSKRVVSTSQFLFQKLQQSSSMKKLKPAVRRLIQILRPGPQGSKPAGAPRVPSRPESSCGRTVQPEGSGSTTASRVLLQRRGRRRITCRPWQHRMASSRCQHQQ